MAENPYFAKIKAAISMQQVIDFLGLTTTPQGNDPNQLRADCPECKHKRALSMSTTDHKFTCFAPKPNPVKGDIIALVAHVKGIRQLAAAELLHEHINTKPAAKPKAQAKKRGKTKSPPVAIMRRATTIADDTDPMEAFIARLA